MMRDGLRRAFFDLDSQATQAAQPFFQIAPQGGALSRAHRQQPSQGPREGPLQNWSDAVNLIGRRHKTDHSRQIEQHPDFEVAREAQPSAGMPEGLHVGTSERLVHLHGCPLGGS